MAHVRSGPPHFFLNVRQLPSLLCMHRLYGPGGCCHRQEALFHGDHRHHYRRRSRLGPTASKAEPTCLCDAPGPVPSIDRIAQVEVEHTFQYQRYSFHQYMSASMEHPLWRACKLKLYDGSKVTFNICRRHGNWQWTSENLLLVTFQHSAHEPSAKRMDFCRIHETNTFLYSVGVNDCIKMAVIHGGEAAFQRWHTRRFSGLAICLTCHDQRLGPVMTCSLLCLQHSIHWKNCYLLDSCWIFVVQGNQMETSSCTCW